MRKQVLETDSRVVDMDKECRDQECEIKRIDANILAAKEEHTRLQT